MILKGEGGWGDGGGGCRGRYRGSWRVGGERRWGGGGEKRLGGGGGS